MRALVASLMVLAGLAVASPAMAASVTIQDGPCSPPSGSLYCYSPPSQSVASGVQITWTNNSAAAPHTVTPCSPTACAGHGAGPASWTGSGTLTTGQTFNQTFTTAGTYYYYCAIHFYPAMHGSITVTAAGDTPPTASFTAMPLSVTTGQSVSFDGSGSTGNQGDMIASYAWDFGDGAKATTQTTTHAFATAGSYQVTLKVTDNEGSSSTQTQTVTVTGVAVDTPPTASFTSSPSSPLAGQAVAFDASATADPDGDSVATYLWNFGDGASQTVSTPTISHTFATAGSYTVSLVATDSHGKQSSTVTAVVTVVAQPGGGGPGGGGGGGGNPPPGGGTASQASKLKLGAKHLCLKKRANCKTTKAKVTFTLSAAASVTVVIARHGKTFRHATIHGRAGANSFNVRAAGLRPGVYTLALTAAGGKTVMLKLTVVAQ